MVALVLSCCLHVHGVLCLAVRQSEANTLMLWDDQSGAVKCIVVMLFILCLWSAGEAVCSCND